MPSGSEIASEISNAVPTITTCSPTASASRSQFSIVQFMASSSCRERASQDRVGEPLEVGAGRAVLRELLHVVAHDGEGPGGAAAELQGALQIAPQVDRLCRGDEL